MNPIPWLVGAAAFALLGGAEVRHFESLAARDIKSKLRGDHAHVDVKTQSHGLLGAMNGDFSRVVIEARDFQTDGLPLFTEPNRSQRGRARELDIKLENFDLAHLHVSSLSASIPECRYDFPLAVNHGKIRLSKSGTGDGQVTVLAPDLEKFIVAKFHEIKRVSVHLANGRAIVEGYGEFLVVKANFHVDAQLVPANGTQISLADAHIELDGKPATDVASAALLQSLNPIIDLDKDLHLYGAIQLREVALQNDRLVASGATTIPVAP